MIDPDKILITAGPTGGKPQRIVVAIAGAIEHRDHIDTNSSISRKRFIGALAEKLGTDPCELASLDDQLVAAADEADAVAESQREAGGDVDDGPRKSQATRLVELADEQGIELWHDPAGEPFATLPVNDHHETHRLRSKTIRQWLARLYYKANTTATSAQAVADALSVLEGKALFDGAEHPAHLRLAEHDGRIYLDLGDPSWRAVEIDPRGWRVVDTPPVRFRRAKAMLALPDPQPGGTLAQLREFINVDDNGWPLVAAWIVAAARPRGPYPVLCLSAEQGSGKTTAASALRKLIDPNDAELRDSPRNPHELMIAATNGWIVGYDNLSTVPAWLSDCLCRLATGAGFSARQLYSDDEEIILRAIRPAMLTGIDDLAVRGDLLDRALLVNLLQIPPELRQTEAKFWQRFDDARPRIIGALLTAVSVAMRRLPSIQLAELPRMADFAIWTTAAEPAIGLADGHFMQTYNRNRESAHVVALEASLIAPFIRQLVDDIGAWTGTATELLDAVNGLAPETTRKQKGWPANARPLANMLRRLAPNLRATGIDLDLDQRSRDRDRKRLVSLTPTGTSPQSIVRSVRSVRTASELDVPSSAADDPQSANEPTPDVADDADDEIQPCSDDENGIELPCQQCGSFELWQTILGNWRCLHCDPPTASTKLRSAVERIRARAKPTAPDDAQRTITSERDQNIDQPGDA